MPRKPRIREVDVAHPPIRMIWADPSSLDDNPLNWRIHTDFQTGVVAELIERHGWIMPLAYNLETGRLINGHARKGISLARELPAVPVIVGTWPEEREPEILASLDPSAALAKGDPEAVQRLLDAMGDVSPLIDRLITEMGESNGILDRMIAELPERFEPTFTPDRPDSGERVDDFPPSGPAPEAAPSPPIDHYRPEPSQVRMWQAYLDTETLPVFRRMVAALRDHYDTDTDTDTVYKAVEETYNRLVVEK